MEFYVFYVLFTVHPCIILQIKPTRCTIFLSMFISFLYMFRATMFPSSGETTVSMRHLVLVTLYGWLPGMHTRNKHTKKNCTPSWLYFQDYGLILLYYSGCEQHKPNFHIYSVKVSAMGPRCHTISQCILKTDNQC